MSSKLAQRQNTAPCRTSSQRNSTSLTRRTLTSSILLALAASTVVLPAHAEQPERFAAGRILVQTRAGLADVELDNALNVRGAPVLRAHGGGGTLKRLHRIGGLNTHVVQVPSSLEKELAAKLAQDPSIKFAEVDKLVPLSSVTPNDTYYPNGWHLPKIDAPNAWSTSMGNGVVIAVLDTGVDANHSDLSGKLVDGWNAVDGSTDTTDVKGHGTEVAGITAAATNNALGVAGVAGSARIMPIKVSNLSDGSAYCSDIANGLTWAAGHGAQVVNISYDGLTASGVVNDAAQYLISKGGVVVVAAGNTGTNPGYSDSPNMISVGSTNNSDTRASSSSYGNHVDVVAPGVSIWTTKLNNGYGSSSGTSYASPIVAGIIALMKAIDPNLAPATAEQILKDTVTDLGDPGWDVYYGYGRVNAAVAVNAVYQQLPDTQPPAVAISSPGAAATVAGTTVAVNINANDNVTVTRVELYANGNLVTSDTAAPFEFSWDSTTVADGSVTLTAYAYDAANNQGVSSGVTVTVDNIPNGDTIAPVVQIKNPKNGTRVTTNTVSISISATDNVGVTEVSCYVDGKWRGTTTNSALNCSWNAKTATAGAHTISATAKDAAGNVGTTSVQVTK